MDPADAVNGIIKKMDEHAHWDEEEKKKEKDKKLILGTMSSRQHSLFCQLGRKSWDEEPTLTKFMEDLAKQADQGYESDVTVQSSYQGLGRHFL